MLLSCKHSFFWKQDIGQKVSIDFLSAASVHVGQLSVFIWTQDIVQSENVSLLNIEIGHNQIGTKFFLMTSFE